MKNHPIIFVTGLILFGISNCWFWLSTLDNIFQISLSIFGMIFGGILIWLGDNQKTEKLNGHSKRHRTAKCPKCGEFDILSGCVGC